MVTVHKYTALYSTTRAYSLKSKLFAFKRHEAEDSVESVRGVGFEPTNP